MSPSAKQQFADTYKREHATTMKVLRAFPQESGDYKPHPGNNSAKQIAWTFVVENNVMLASIKGPLNLGAAFPPAPATFAECVAAYEESAKKLTTELEKTPESRLSETVKFPSGRNQMADYPVSEFLWFMLMDSVHHRGQLSVYIRPAGGKVPSIYGPSGDEPWR
jgi:uncharacterized damage-inducible protein DinB